MEECSEQKTHMIDHHDAYSLSIVAFENEDSSQIHLTDEKLPWILSMGENSERATHMLDHQGWIRIPVTTARGPVFISTVILMPLMYHMTITLHCIVSPDSDWHSTDWHIQKTVSRVNQLG